MNVLLGVCGSISCYKSIDLMRAMIKQGHQVTVVLTAGALKFVRAETYRYLGAKAVYLPSDDFRPQHLDQNQTVLHISLARWMERMVVAPATASLLARLSQGQATDLLSSIFLSNTDRPVIIYPAMNTQMWEHPLTQDNLHRLQRLPWVGLYPPAQGELACGESGPGKLPEIEAIADSFWCYPVNSIQKKNKARKKILMTTGATAAILDPVRFLTNSSTGETGRALAAHFLSQGHELSVVAGKSSTPRLDYLKALPGFHLYRLNTTQEVKNLVDQLWPKHDLYISAAALSDFEFKTSAEKIQKSQIKGHLEIAVAPDVLAGVLAQKRPGQKVIGFAAQYPLTKQALLDKYGRKPVDLLIGNQVHHGLGLGTEHEGQQGFAQATGHYLIVKKGQVVFEGDLAKSQLAQIIERELELS